MLAPVHLPPSLGADPVEMHHATVWEAVAPAAGDPTALVQGDVRRSGRDFDDRAGGLASAFLAAGVGPDSKVGLMPDNAPELMGGDSAALEIRAAPFNVSSGEKVFPEEVEEVFKAHPAVEDCLVFGAADERFGQRVAAVAAKSDAAVDEELVAAARPRLASSKVPRRIVTVGVVPRMPSRRADDPAARSLFEAAP